MPRVWCIWIISYDRKARHNYDYCIEADSRLISFLDFREKNGRTTLKSKSKRSISSTISMIDNSIWLKGSISIKLSLKKLFQKKRRHQSRSKNNGTSSSSGSSNMKPPKSKSYHNPYYGWRFQNWENPKLYDFCFTK